MERKEDLINSTWLDLCIFSAKAFLTTRRLFRASPPIPSEFVFIPPLQKSSKFHEDQQIVKTHTYQDPSIYVNSNFPHVCHTVSRVWVHCPDLVCSGCFYFFYKTLPNLKNDYLFIIENLLEHRIIVIFQESKIFIHLSSSMPRFFFRILDFSRSVRG